MRGLCWKRAESTGEEKEVGADLTNWVGGVWSGSCENGLRWVG